MQKQFCASTNAMKLLVMKVLAMKLLAGVLGVSVMLAANAAVAAAKKQKPAPQAAYSSLCRGANLYQCGPLYNSTDYLGTDPDPFIRAMIQRDLGPKYGGPE